MPGPELQRETVAVRDAFTVAPSATLAQAAERIAGGAPLLFVAEGGGGLRGVVEPMDVRVALAEGADGSTGIERWIRAADPIPLGDRRVADAAGAGPPAPTGAARLVVDADGRPAGLEVERFAPWPLEAVVMAGGEGRRLRPLTEDTPKPLLDVAGKPILARLVEHLARFGVRRCLVAINYLGDAVRDFLGDGGDFGVEVEYVEEREPLGTAGALGLVAGRLERTFLLVNGDILTRVDLAAMLGHHLASGAPVTVGTVPYRWRIPYGVIEASDAGGRAGIRRIQEKPLYRFETNAGIYVLEPEVLDELEPDVACDMVSLLNGLADRHGAVGRFPLVEYWSDIGLRADFERVQADARRMDAEDGGGAPAR